MAPKDVMPLQNGHMATTAPHSPSLHGHGMASFVKHSQHIVCEQQSAMVCDLRHFSSMQYVFLHIEHATSSLGIGKLISRTEDRIYRYAGRIIFAVQLTHMTTAVTKKKIKRSPREVTPDAPSSRVRPVAPGAPVKKKKKRVTKTSARLRNPSVKKRLF